MRAAAIVRIGTRIGVAVAGLTLVAGCATSTSGTPEPTSGATRSGDSSSSGSGSAAPKVTTPIDVSKFAANPCSSLTTAQLTTLGLTGMNQQGTGGPAGAGIPNQPTGTICTWLYPNNAVIAVGFLTGFPDGIPQGLNYYFEDGIQPARPGVLDVDGQPTVYGQVEASQQYCQLAVGASDTAVVAVSADAWTTGDPCQEALVVAQATITTIKSAG